jgi:hypothetical protein
MSWIRKLLNVFYKEKHTFIKYQFGDNEVQKILGEYVVYDRKIINLNEYKVLGIQYFSQAGYMEIEIAPKELTPPPPPPNIEQPPLQNNNIENIPYQAGSK